MTFGDKITLLVEGYRLKALKPSWATTFKTSREAEYAPQPVSWSALSKAREKERDRRAAKRKAAMNFVLRRLDEELHPLVNIVAALKSIRRVDAIRALLGPDKDMLIRAAKTFLEEREQ